MQHPTDGYLHRLSQQLRLLARVQDGAINPAIEQPREQLNELLDQVLDGYRLNDLQLRHIRWCEDLIRLNQPAVKQLELTWAA